MASNDKPWLALIVMLAACSGVSLKDKTACRDQGDCLAGYACIDQECVATSEGCDAFCANFCFALSSCDIDPGASCSDDCVVAVSEGDCTSIEPLDRLPCDQLEHAVECAGYCRALCERGAECATIDVDLCALGCDDKLPQICNARSVPVRDCEQIKTEARSYDNAGRALVEGGEVGSSYSPNAYGLCATAYDCEDSLGCSSETSTCVACTSDAECDPGWGAMACTSAGCATVECVNDDDCSSDVCDVTAHECRDCREDGDCTSGACDVESQTCVACHTDAQCDPDLFPACDSEAMTCVQCLTDEHCEQGIFNSVFLACDAEVQRCVQCTEDRHCTDPSRPACNTDTKICERCVTNEHCTDPLASRCEVPGNLCAPCLADADCAHLDATPFCDLENGGCRE